VTTSKVLVPVIIILVVTVSLLYLPIALMSQVSSVKWDDWDWIRGGGRNCFFLMCPDNVEPLSYIRYLVPVLQILNML
jgi:hypothetical protein